MGEMLKNFRAEPHLEKENKDLTNMHRAVLNNKANAALHLDQWQNALKATEAALAIKQDDEMALFRKAQALEALGRTDEAREALDEVEQIAEDMDDEFKDMIMSDVNELRDTIKDVEKRAAADYGKMFKAMGDKGVFGGGRFLPDGTSPPPALTGEEERQLKKMKDRQEYFEAKAKYEVEQRKQAGGKPTATLNDQELPTPNRPTALSLRSMERSVTLTRAQAEQLLEELLSTYSAEAFQKKVHAEAKAVMFEMQPFLRRLKKTAFVVQEPLLVKWGFDPSEEGLQEMMLCLSDHTNKNEQLRKLGDETTRMLYGGEDGMWGMT